MRKLSEKKAFMKRLGIFHANRTTKCLRNYGRIKGEVWSTANQLRPLPSNFIAGRPKATLLLWFIGDFRFGLLLFIVFRVIYKYKNRKRKKDVKC